ncbi:VOC family protein [Streptomyces sp. NPDC055243]|uniref:VOC family protein n=1 Tax=Streptomyces sp. NPDC055243 TaxID=3365720 RepID=UPI0037D80968
MTATTVDAPGARALARFYQALLGWPVAKKEPDWVEIAPPGGGTGLSFQTEPFFTRPQWPSAPSGQQIMMHLDIEVDDLASAAEFALGLGATLADFQPQEDVRVLHDPAGHPFCLWVRPTSGA